MVVVRTVFQYFLLLWEYLDLCLGLFVVNCFVRKNCTECVIEYMCFGIENEIASGPDIFWVFIFVV